MVDNAHCLTEFRFLNGAPPLGLGIGDQYEEMRVDQILSRLEESPQGSTPLCSHIFSVTQQIENIQDELRARSQRAIIVIFTDGIPTDGDISVALKPLKLLPVTVVLRFCTNDSSLVEYWHNVANDIELDIDVLDNLIGEAKVVYKYNPWLTYADPIHRLREFGCTSKEIDLLDERPLSLDQVRTVCSYL